MTFTLQVVGPRPTAGDLVIEAETPLSGIHFLTEFGRAVRRSVDHVASYRHVTLGSVATYEMNVPQSVALESHLFEDSDKFTVIVDPNLLADFIFYSGSLKRGSTHTPCYPYTSNEATLTSMVDELGFIEVWSQLGFPGYITIKDDHYVAGDIDDIDGDDSGSGGGADPGCDGCTPDVFPPYPPHPGPFPPPPPPGPHPGPHRRHRRHYPYPTPTPPPGPRPPHQDPGIDPRNPPPGTLAIGGEFYNPLPTHKGY